MELSNTRIVPAPPATVWTALNDPAVLKECLPGCEVLERTGDGTFRVVMAARVGPVAARFNGTMRMADVAAPEVELRRGRRCKGQCRCREENLDRFHQVALKPKLRTLV